MKCKNEIEIDNRVVGREHKLIQSYVYNKYFVSTAYRESSVAIIPSMWYYETIAWEWDKDTKKRGKMLLMEDSGNFPKTAMENHFKICANLNINSFI